MDKDIFNKIKAGDEKAFEKLFRHMYQALCAYANKFLQDLDLAEEFTQDVFYRLWEKREQLDINISLESYIYKSVYNKCITYIQRNKLKARYEKYIQYSHIQHGNDASEMVRMQELSELVNKTLKTLPDKTQVIFKLSRFEGLKYHEIADKLSVSVKTVEANMTRALKLFRKNLGAYINFAS